MVLKQDHLQPGDCISCDHYLSPVPGRVIADSGYSSSRHGYTCGTIYVDHASGFVFVGHQRTTSAEETIRSKVLVEQAAKDAGFKIKKYHSDNGIFSSKEFKQHCKSQDQEQSFSGVC
jgi:transposase InsO family protein